MQKLMKLLIILSLAGLISAVSKSVSVFDKNTKQLVTSSSTLVWESYNPNDSKQLSDSVVGGTVVGEDVSYYIVLYIFFCNFLKVTFELVLIETSIILLHNYSMECIFFNLFYLNSSTEI